MRAKSLLPLLLLLVAASAVLYFSEWVEVSQDVGFSEAAMRNRHLAAGRFLAEFGVDVQMRSGVRLLDELPPVEDTILLTGSRRSLTEQRVMRLLDWVAAGGRLLVLALEHWDVATQRSSDPLLDSLGVELHEEIRVAEDARELPIAELFPNLLETAQCGIPGGITPVDFADQEQMFAVSMHPSRYLAYSGTLEPMFAISPVGPQILFLKNGFGSVAVLTDHRMWRNERIGCVDHAHLLRTLTEARPTLWWVHHTQMDALPMLMWQRWPLAIVFGVLLFVGWWWRNALRITRPVIRVSGVRRQLMEHIEGIARFRWQQDDAAGLLAGLRAEVLMAAGIDQVDDPALADLAGRAGLSTSRVQQVLFEDVVGDARRFTDTVRDLQQLRQSQKWEQAGG